MEYSVYDLIRILLKKWYVILLVMALLGGAAGVLSQKSYQTALAEYEDYTARELPVNTETGDLTAVSHCNFTLTDMGYYRQQAVPKKAFIDAYLSDAGKEMPYDRLYQEAEDAFAVASGDFSSLFMSKTVLAEVQAFAARQDLLEPATVAADGSVSGEDTPLDVSGHLSADLSKEGLVTVTITGLPEDTCDTLLSAYWQAVEAQGGALYSMQVQHQALTRVYAPYTPSLTADAILSQMVMRRPERAPVFINAACKGAAFGFLFACFGVLLYTFIRDTAPAEKRRGSKETA
nr:MAG TPA: Chain length determinant protein [Caudoviricetes sp.]